MGTPEGICEASSVASSKTVPLGFSSTENREPCPDDTSFSKVPAPRHHNPELGKCLDKDEIKKEFCKRSLEYNTFCHTFNKVSEKQKNEKTSKKKSSKRCYTCNPRGKVLKHIIKKEESITFHHDLWNRPYVIVTPNRHYSNLRDCSDKELIELFRGIETFCSFWNIKDYSLLYNNEGWSNTSHFHIKIKASENFIRRMKQDHFNILKRSKEYRIPSTETRQED